MNETEDSIPRAREGRRLGHVPGLDGLRGIAVLLVVVYHTRFLANRYTGKITTTHGFGWVNSFASGGELGVDVFFVLSGFLITGLLLAERDRSGTVGFRRFYGRRALRLLPALVVVLAAHMIWSLYAPASAHLTMHREITTVFAALTYWLNYGLMAHRPLITPDLEHLWSLSVEEQFYVIWPVALFFLMRRRAAVVPIALTAAIVAVMVNRAYLSQYPSSAAYVRTDTRADALLIGALLAWAWTRGWTPKINLRAAAWWSAGLMVLMIGTTHTRLPLLYKGGFTLFAAAVAIVILAVVEADWGRALRWRPLGSVGHVSYGLYLWHGAIFVAIVEYGHPRWVVSRVALAYALTALATWLSWVLIERRALALRHRLGPEPAVVHEQL